MTNVRQMDDEFTGNAYALTRDKHNSTCSVLHWQRIASVRSASHLNFIIQRIKHKHNECEEQEK